MKKITSAICFTFVMSMPAIANEPASSSNSWLVDAETNEQRFELLEGYLGGFSHAMREVGARYVSIHEALTRDNPELATYHWDKIRGAIENGYLKRPARQANADAIFLDKLWGEVNDALQSGDSDKAWGGFENAKAGCMACHEAEEVAFMNNQPMFDLGRPE